MKYFLISILFLTLSAAQNCHGPSDAPSQKLVQKDLDGLHKAYFASGCFWCVEAIFESVIGVEEAISGYTGGKTQDPTYESVSAGVTDHAEAVEVYYDSTKIDYPTLLKVFFGSHDPTTLNRQGPDAGTQYRSGIYYQNDNEKELILDLISDLREKDTFKGEITTEVAPLSIFYRAEEYHQDYEMKNPNNPYVRAVSIPRLKKFQRAYPELLKEAH
ncbi:MAG: peptide-methionine (S)-S-oxide reductase MsrA [Saprospiraceae bacterium]|nr:peptide-methionine (S)-S-oxide reductase MsrA [Saprospiraceae bacterium]